MKNKKVYILMFVFMFCFSISGVKADNFTLSFGTKSEKIDVKISPSGDFDTTSSIICEVHGDEDDVTVSGCSFIGSSINNNNYSFVGNVGKSKKYNVKVSNKKEDNNSLRMTSFNAACNKSTKYINSYTCTVSSIVFKWEKHDECNNPDRSGNNHGIPGVISCVGGSPIFCDKYKKMKDDEVKDKCPGAYGDNNDLKAKDILKKCETLDNASFEKWCKYGKNGGATRNQDAVPDIHDYKYDSAKYGVGKTITCKKLLGSDNVKLIRTYLFYICAAGVIIVIVLGISDFVKAIASSDDDALMTAWKRLKNRIISVIILLLLPALVNFVLSFVDDNMHLEIVDKNGEVKKDISVKFGKASDCGL
ncbi:MAG: hypothetical protein IKE75_01170 [Bacilli bacterium]|nr:hypothetical protein [Bacilli bacterium]